MPKNIKPILALLTVSLIWGISAVVIKYTLNYIPPFSFLYIRFVLASIVLYFLVDWEKHKYLINVKRKEFIKIFLIGALGSSVNLGLYFWGINFTTAIEATIIYSFSPILIVFGGVVLLKEKLTKLGIIGLITTLLGFCIVVFHPLLQSGTESAVGTSFVGNFLVLLSVLAWASYSLISKNLFNHDKSGERFSPVFITFISFFAGAITLIPFGMYEIWTAQIDYVRAAPGILYMTFFSTVVAYTFFEYGVKKIDVSRASLFQYIQPVFTIPIAMVFLGEKFSVYYLIGGALLAAGIYLSEIKSSVK